MEIAHIFNEVKSNKNDNKSYIDFQEFNGAFWKTKSQNYKPPQSIDKLDLDFAKMYYYALTPVDEQNIISKYDDYKINSIVDKLGENLLLISGDFWGIQKFITEDLTTSKASKILRSRSAMVLLITYAVVQEIKKIFQNSELLLFGAGKFMIVAQDKYKEQLEKIQKELDKYFLKNFFAQNGFILSSSTTTKDRLLHQSCMESDLDGLGADNDVKKLNKFDLLNVEDKDIIIDPFCEKAKKDDEICTFCKKRSESFKIDYSTYACEICANQILLGAKLTKNNYLSIFYSKKEKNKDNIKLIKLFDTTYYAKFSNSIENSEGDTFDISEDDYFDYPKWALKSFIPLNENNEIKTFEEYIKIGDKTISSGLMALKADIDLLGNTFRAFYKENFKKFNRLSREVDYFFSEYITRLISKKYKNVYTVFAGGDDLFLIGEYKEIVALAKDMRDEFLTFSLQKTTISMGLVMFKPSTPINFISKMVDEAEKRAKMERDSIDIFGISMKFDEFTEIEKDFDEVVKYLKDNSVETTTFYYWLIDLCDMKENLYRALSQEKKYKDYKFNPNDAMWKSKLNYMIRRNIKRINNDNEIFTKISNLIEKGEKFKPSIFLKIYQNRDEKKE